ncbi:unnamed protein product, partial [Rotaria magnacalcarata]
ISNNYALGIFHFNTPTPSRPFALRRRRQRRRQRLRQRLDEQFRQHPQYNRRQRQQQEREEQRRRQLQENQRRRQQQQRDRQWQQQREQNETPSQREQRQQRQQARIQREEERRQQRERQLQEQQSTSITTNHGIHRSYSYLEREHEYYLSHGFPEELDEIDPVEILKLIELENMNTMERAAQDHLEHYEQSISKEQVIQINTILGKSGPNSTEEELLKTQKAKQEELEQYMEYQLLMLQNDEIERM